MMNKKQMVILVMDGLMIWYGNLFFTTASTLLNIIGVLIIIGLVYLNIKFFKK